MSTPHVDPNAVFDTLGRHMLVDGFHLVMDLEKSHGSWIVDARDGRKYLDFYTFFATTPLGHNQVEPVHKHVAAQGVEDGVRIKVRIGHGGPQEMSYSMYGWVWSGERHA